MASVQIRADLAPSMAMQRARDLLAPVLPKHENVVEAERILMAAQRQYDLMQSRRQVDPFDRARLLLEDGYGLGRDQALRLIETDANVRAVHDAALNVIARLLRNER